METTIKVKVAGWVMNQIFDNSQVINVKYYEIIGGLTDEEDYHREKVYLYSALIRHPEETDAKQLFNQEVKRFENLNKQKKP